jgi:hypothetical protein
VSPISTWPSFKCIFFQLVKKFQLQIIVLCDKFCRFKALKIGLCQIKRVVQEIKTKIVCILNDAFLPLEMSNIFVATRFIFHNFINFFLRKYFVAFLHRHDACQRTDYTKLYSFKFNCNMVSLTAANTNRMFSVSETKKKGPDGPHNVSSMFKKLKIIEVFHCNSWWRIRDIEKGTNWFNTFSRPYKRRASSLLKCQTHFWSCFLSPQEFRVCKL